MNNQDKIARMVKALGNLLRVSINRKIIFTIKDQIDLLNDSEGARHVLENFPNSVAISALTGEGTEDLLTKIDDVLFENYMDLSVWIPYKEGRLISLFHEQGQVDRIEHRNGGMQITGRLPERLNNQFSPYVKSKI